MADDPTPDEFRHGIWWRQVSNDTMRPATGQECAAEIQRLRDESALARGLLAEADALLTEGATGSRGSVWWLVAAAVVSAVETWLNWRTQLWDRAIINGFCAGCCLGVMLASFVDSRSRLSARSDARSERNVGC